MPLQLKSFPLCLMNLSSSDGRLAEHHQPSNTTTRQPCCMLSFYFQSDTAQNSPDDSDQEPAEIVVEQPATSEIFVIWRVPSLTFWWQIIALSYYSLDQMTSCTYSLFDEKLKLSYGDLPRSHSGCRLNALLVNTFKTEIISLKSDESVPSDGSFAKHHQPPNTKTQQPCSMLSFYFLSDTTWNSPDDSGQEPTEIVTKQLAMSELCVIDIHRYGMFPHLHFNDKSTFYLATETDGLTSRHAIPLSPCRNGIVGMSARGCNWYHPD